MVIERAPETFAAHGVVGDDQHLAMVAASIAAGNTAARLWDVTHGEDAVSLLWDKGNNVFYLAGELTHDATVREVAALISDTIRPMAIAEGRAYFKTRPLTPSLAERLAAVFDPVRLRQRSTLFYAYTRSQPPQVAPPRVADVRIVPIDDALLHDSTLGNGELIREEIGWMWPSLDRFVARGFGYAAVLEREAIGWCTAEYVSESRCGIGIATVPAYERRGLATATAAAFVSHCVERGITPYWECGSDNLPSIRVAEKLGFALLAHESFAIGGFES
jgi:RimJ/RimL family protein N-acetyltransferase